MPLIDDCSEDAFQQNMASELEAGKSPDQATAIAHDVMRRACNAAGKPVPKKAKSREYLESALDSAKELLPAWVFAVIHQAALPRSGGRVRSRLRKLQAAARVSMNPPSLKSLTSELQKEIEHEIASLAGESRLFGTREGQTRKGLANGMEDAGAHAHGLDRRAGVTHMDGLHRHWFTVPGSDDLLCTSEDGVHGHSILDLGGDGGQHSHMIEVRSGGGSYTKLQTSIDGGHWHDEQLETTGFGGTHQHILKLVDGTEIKSMTVAEYVDKYRLTDSVGPKMPPASEIANALSRIRMLDEEVMMLRSLPVEQAFAQLSSGMPISCDTNLSMEVVAKTIDGIDVSFADSDEAFSVSCAGTLELSEGDIVDVLGDQVTKRSERLWPMTVEEASRHIDSLDDIRAMSRKIEWSGPADAKMVFIAAAPNQLESARGGGIVGADAEIFQKHYLTPLGLTRDDAAVGFISPHWMPDPVDSSRIAPWLDAAKEKIANYGEARVVAIGKAAKEALGDLVCAWVPHPAVVRKSGDTSQVDRKIRRLALDGAASMVDNNVTRSERSTGPLADADGGPDKHVVVLKADRPEMQIVYGVVLDPNQIDSQNDWAPPGDIQSTAHGYLQKSRVVGLEHERRIQAKVVESFVEQYPTKKDYKAAMDGRPHKVTRRKFGDDYLHSGAWVLGVKLEDREWSDYKTGKLTGFSMGGFSVKTPFDASMMPKIEVVDLIESK